MMKPIIEERARAQQATAGGDKKSEEAKSLRQKSDEAILCCGCLHYTYDKGDRCTLHHEELSACSIACSSFEQNPECVDDEEDNETPSKPAEPIRTDSTVADMAGVSRDTVRKVEAIKRRKQIWEALHPEGGSICATPGGQQVVGFAADTAKLSGEPKSSINRHLSRAEALGEDLLKVAGICKRVIGGQKYKGRNLAEAALIGPASQMCSLCTFQNVGCVYLSVNVGATTRSHIRSI